MRFSDAHIVNRIGNSRQWEQHNSGRSMTLDSVGLEALLEVFVDLVVVRVAAPCLHFALKFAVVAMEFVAFVAEVVGIEAV